MGWHIILPFVIMLEFRVIFRNSVRKEGFETGKHRRIGIFYDWAKRNALHPQSLLLYFSSHNFKLVFQLMKN
jgi:hypothetical protein